MKHVHSAGDGHHRSVGADGVEYGETGGAPGGERCGERACGECPDDDGAERAERSPAA